MFKSIATALVVLLTAQSATEPESPLPADARAREYLQTFSAEVGDWVVENRLMRSPGQSDTVYFRVEIAYAMDGLALHADWYDRDAGTFIGRVIRTYDPDSAEIVQRWFAASTSSWTDSRQQVEWTDGAYGNAWTGEDQFGPFEARSSTRYLEDGGFEWLIERKYPGTDWFEIDYGRARASAD